jgi:spore coat polysaccharide biosynthesis protein SpsF
MPEVWIITQARMTSTRLPGKILLRAGAKTLLEHHIDRLSHFGSNIVVATTDRNSDEPVVAFCKQKNIHCMRGSEEDVMDRFVKAIEAFVSPNDIVVRVTSDCPLIDASLIEQGVKAFVEESPKDPYVSNCFPRSFARGFDFELFRASSLLDAASKTNDPFDREHVTPYLWKNKSGDTILKNISQEKDHSSLRICVDTPEDYTLIKKLIEEHGCSEMRYAEIEALLISHPELVAINAHIEQKKN